MSFYWKWVAARSLIPALVLFGAALTIDQLDKILPYQEQGTWSRIFIKSTPLLLNFLALASVVISECWIIRMRFPQVRWRTYALCRGLLPCITSTLALLSATARADGLSSSIPFAASGTPPTYWYLVGLITIPMFILWISVPYLLAWTALKPFATGRRGWVVCCTAGAISPIVSGSFQTLMKVEILRNGSFWMFASVDDVVLFWDVVNQLLYALISGIGVARLRPIPEGTS